MCAKDVDPDQSAPSGAVWSGSSLPLDLSVSILRISTVDDYMSHVTTKPTEWVCAQRRLRSAWASFQSDQSSLCAQWVAKDPSFLHADNEDSDQTVHAHFVGFVIDDYITVVVVFCSQVYVGTQFVTIDPSLCWMLTSRDLSTSKKYEFKKLKRNYQEEAFPEGIYISRLMTKSTKWHVRPAKTQISLGIRPVRSRSSLSRWRNLGSLATQWAHSEDWSDWVDAQADPSLRWAHSHFVGFVMQQLRSVPLHTMKIWTIGTQKKLLLS